MGRFLGLLWDVLGCTRGGPITKLFGGGSPKPPAPPPPLPMPDLMDPGIIAEQRRRMRSRLAESGRASTLLTGDSGDYSSDKLGSR